MKKFLLILFISFTSFLVLAKAQTLGTVSQLTPVASNIGRFSKRLPANRNLIINKDNLKFEVLTESINLPDNKKGVAVTIKTIYNEVVFENISDKVTARLEIYGRITSEDKTIDGFFEERLSENVKVADLTKGLNKEIVLHKIFELSEGNYQIGVIFTDIASGIRGVKVIKFKVPNFKNTQTND